MCSHLLLSGSVYHYDSMISAASAQDITPRRLDLQMLFCLANRGTFAGLYTSIENLSFYGPKRHQTLKTELSQATGGSSNK